MFFLLATLWVLMTFDLDQYLTVRTGAPFFRIPVLLVPILAAATMARWHKRAVYWPLIGFTILHLGASIFAENAGVARGPLKYMIYVLVLFASSAIFLDTPQKVKVVLKVYLLSFVWLGFQGLFHAGRITWHGLLNNEDSYGPLMVILIPIGFFFAQATSSKVWRWIGRAAFALAVLGVIVSFARGAALAAMAVLVYIILRAPNKAKMLVAILVAAVVLLPLIPLFVPVDKYTAEIASSTQGDEGRKAVWRLAFLVFETSPVWGVGAANFGVVGVQIAPPEVTKQLGAGIYQFAVHNPTFEILAEEGLLGLAAWIAMLVSIVRWIRGLRTEPALAVWRQRGGGGVDLRLISLGLEGALVAYLGTSIFYNQLYYIHWIWSILILSYVLFHLTRPGGDTASAESRRRVGPTRFRGSRDLR